MVKSSKDFSSIDAIQAIIREANAIRLPKCFDDDTWSILEQSGMEVSVPVSYLVPAMISTVAHLMGDSYFKVNKKFKQKFIFYTALLTNPSSGKSQAMNIFSNAARLVEEANNVSGINSSLRNAATVEALVEMLKSNPRIISFWDEASAFTGSLGRYTNGGVAYDRSIYLELFNGPERYNRDLKAATTQLVNPSLNMVMGGHASSFIEQIKEEKLRFDDGLFQRFLFNAPEGLINVNEEDIYYSVESSVSIVSILYTIQQICVKPRVFRFDTEALTEYFKITNGFRRLIEQSATYDAFIGAMFGKAKTHLVRLAGVLSIFSKTIALLKFIPESKLDTIEEPFQTKIKYQLENNHQFMESIGTVGVESLKQAEILVRYFNGHRLVLADYNFNLNKHGASNLIEEVTLYLQQLHLKKPVTKLPEKHIDKKLLNVIRQILIFDGQIVSNAKLCSKHHLKNDQTTPAFKYLEKIGLGSIETRQSANKKKVIHFVKINPDEIKNNLKMTDLLHDLKVTANEYIQAYNNFIGDSNLSETESTATESDAFERKIYSQVSPSRPNYGIQLTNHILLSSTDNGVLTNAHSSTTSGYVSNDISSKNLITSTPMSPPRAEEETLTNEDLLENESSNETLDQESSTKIVDDTLIQENSNDTHMEQVSVVQSVPNRKNQKVDNRTGKRRGKYNKKSTTKDEKALVKSVSSSSSSGGSSNSRRKSKSDTTVKRKYEFKSSKTSNASRVSLDTIGSNKI